MNTPSKYNRSEGFFEGYQNIKLFFQVWENPQAQGTVIITHGHGEHSDSYNRLVDAFADDKWTFYGWDLRGHGRSEGRRGYVHDFDEYCQDYKIFVEKIMALEKVKKGPVILLCHSMGGLIQFKTLLRYPQIQATALAASAPLFGLALDVPALKARGASFIRAFLPTLTMSNEIGNSMLTSDPDVIREFEQDPYRHTRISAAAFIGFLESFITVNPRAHEITMPAIFMVAEHDPVVSTQAVEKFYEHIGSKKKELHLYPNAKHEIFNDTMRATVFADLKKFLDTFLEPS